MDFSYPLTSKVRFSRSQGVSFKIAVTGANSYIGRHILQYARAKGIGVHVLAREKSVAENGFQFFPFDLHQGCSKEALEGVDCLIHLAWARPNKTRLQNDKKINWDGTRRLIDLAKSAGVKKRIFVSSQLADSKAKSFYARNKFEVEQLFAEIGDVIVRAGYVFGGEPSGFYRQTLATIQKTKILPIIRKNAPLNPIHIEDLTDNIFKIARDLKPAGALLFSFGSPEPILLKEFFQCLARNHFQKNLKTVPLPKYPLYFIFWLMSFVHPKANDFSERIGGILSAKAMATECDLARLSADLGRTREFVDRGFYEGLLQEGMTLSKYLFKKSDADLAKRYVSKIQAVPFQKPLPLPKIVHMFPWLAAFFERRSFQKRIHLMVLLHEENFLPSRPTVLGFLKDVVSVVLKEGLSWPVRFLMQKIFWRK